MARQEISVKQGVTMIVMFILGTTFLVSPGIEAKQDIWISFLISIGLSMVLVCMYARMMSHIPGKDFFAILETMLGRPLAVLFFAIMAIYYWICGWKQSERESGADERECIRCRSR